MRVRVLGDADSLAGTAAGIIAAKARAAVRARGSFVVALSGGRSPQRMFRALACEKVPWDGVHVVQVDERIAPLGHADRNLTHLRTSLLDRVPLTEEQVHAMPVESAALEEAAASYAQRLSDIAGSPPVLDLVHLGLGADGHTASLVPGDPVLDENATDVALTGVYQGRRRMTLTYPILNRSRQILWIVSGREKAGVLGRLQAADLSIPAARVRRSGALLLADYEATGQPRAAEANGARRGDAS